MTIRHLRGGVALIGTAAEFASANPVPLARQLTLETDTGVQKIGDGTTHYASLTALPAGQGGGGGGGLQGMSYAWPNAPAGSPTDLDSWLSSLVWAEANIRTASDWNGDGTLADLPAVTGIAGNDASGLTLPSGGVYLLSVTAELTFPAETIIGEGALMFGGDTNDYARVPMVQSGAVARGGGSFLLTTIGSGHVRLRWISADPFVPEAAVPTDFLINLQIARVG